MDESERRVVIEILYEEGRVPRSEQTEEWVRTGNAFSVAVLIDNKICEMDLTAYAMKRAGK